MSLVVGGFGKKEERNSELRMLLEYLGDFKTFLLRGDTGV